MNQVLEESHRGPTLAHRIAAVFRPRRPQPRPCEPEALGEGLTPSPEEATRHAGSQRWLEGLLTSYSWLDGI